MLLETAPYNEEKSGENLLEDFKRVATDFEIADRKFVLINDGAKNNGKFARLSESDKEINIAIRIVCVAHNIHNLVYTDIFQPSKNNPFSDADLTTLKAKINRIHQTLHYKKNVIKTLVQKKHSDLIWDEILTHIDENAEYAFESSIPGIKTTHLKKSNATRWMSTLAMVRSFLPLTDVVNDLLLDQNKMRLLLSKNDVQLLKDLETIFTIFEEAVLTFQVSNLHYIYI